MNNVYIIFIVNSLVQKLRNEINFFFLFSIFCYIINPTLHELILMVNLS